MNNYYNNIKKEKNKHLDYKMYKKIESEYNYYMSSKENEIGLTKFKRKLAEMTGTTVSNIYKIINSGLITVYNYDYTERIEFSAEVALKKRTKKTIESNSSKRESSKSFVQLVIKELRSNYNINSVDEIIHDLKLNRENEIEGFSKEELPMKTKRKTKNKRKEGKTNPKGISIEERPFEPEDKSEFVHWEGDTIVGSRNIEKKVVLFSH